MALVAFVRGANVGGHRRFRPSLLARALAAYDVVNIGAAGTFVVRRPGRAATFRAVLRAALPFDAHIMLCDAREVLRIANEHPLHPFHRRAPAGVTRFVSVMPKAGQAHVTAPVVLPARGRWLVRLVGSDGQFLFGEYRRDMKTIGYLGEIDRLVGAPVTTRGWSTIRAVVNALSEET